MIKRAVIALLVVLLVTSIASAREFNGVDMPETLQIDGATVALNGVGLRAVLFIKPYVGGLYLTGPETEGNTVMSADEPMAILLHMIDDVGQSMMKRSLYNGMRNSVKSTGGDFEPLKNRIETLKSFFDDEIKKGDIYEFKYQPDTGLKVIKNDELRGTIEGQDFKQAFFGIWLNSESPADKDLRTAMLAGDMQVDVAQLEANAKAAEAEKKAAAAAAQAEEQKAMELAAAEQAAAEKAAAEKQARAEADMKAAEEQARVEAEKKAAEEKAAAAAEKKASEEKMAQTETATASAKKKTAAEIESEDIYFGYNDASLSGQAKQKLDGKIEWMNANPNASVIVEVYADPRGSTEYNMWLSEKRGKSAIAYMTDAGINASRIELKVYGEENLKQAGNTPTGWAKNRRAHFKVVE